MKELEQLVRRHILKLKHFDYALSAHRQSDHIFLDGNENPYNAPVNRYPDPFQSDIKKKLSRLKGIIRECIFLGNGTDEIVDIVYRCFCEPAHDNVVAIEPTFCSYRRFADVNDVEYRSVPLQENFSLSADWVLDACDDNTKVIWLCTPNNPTGNSLDRNEIIEIAKRFQGLVVVDEAYADFSKQKSLLYELDSCPNIVVLNTFSGAWGCAGLRLGIAYAQPAIVNILNKVKQPYNISSMVQERISSELDNRWETEKRVNIILMERERMVEAFKLLPICKKVYPTDANFILVEMTDADDIYSYLRQNGVMVKNVSDMPQCENCLRISIGSKSDNSELLSVLRQFKSKEE